MASGKPPGSKENRAWHWVRFLAAILALLIAAAHLSAASPSPSSATHAVPSAANSTAPITSGQAQRAHYSSGFQLIGTWIDIEIVSYVVIAVIFLFGMRSWYGPAALFNGFNVILYFLSGVIAIPGITSAAFGNRFAALPFSLSSGMLIVSWIALLVLSVLLLAYDSGSNLDRLYRTGRP